MPGREGRKEANSSLFATTTLSPKENRKQFPGEAVRELDAALAEAGWGHAWEWEYLP